MNANILKLTLQFFLSGTVVVLAVVLAKYVDSKWAGLVVALPTLTVLGLLFISAGADEATVSRYLLSALAFMIPAAIYIASLYVLHVRFSLVSSVFLSVIPFSIAVYVVQRII